MKISVIITYKDNSSLNIDIEREHVEDFMDSVQNHEFFWEQGNVGILINPEEVKYVLVDDVDGEKELMEKDMKRYKAYNEKIRKLREEGYFFGYE